MFRVLAIFILLFFQSQLLFGQPDQTNVPPKREQQDQANQEDFRDLRPQDTTQRMNELERSVRQLQQQIDRLTSTVNQDRQEFSYTNQSVGSLKRQVDQMSGKIDDLKSDQREIERRIGR